MRPVLIELPRLRVYSYPAMLYAGIVAGLAAGGAVAEADGIDPNRFAAATLVLLIPALVGARLLFVAHNAAAFRAEPRRIWDRAGGGATLYGGLAAAVACSVALLPLVGLGFWAFWDAAVFTMLVAMVPTKAGCLMNGCCGGHLGRVPFQVVEAATALVLIPVALEVRAADEPAGATFLAVVAAYACVRLALGRGRGTATLMLVAALAALAGVLA